MTCYGPTYGFQIEELVFSQTILYIWFMSHRFTCLHEFLRE